MGSVPEGMCRRAGSIIIVEGGFCSPPAGELMAPLIRQKKRSDTPREAAPEK